MTNGAAPMIVTDPIREVERTLATELVRALRRVLGFAASEVQVHHRERTIVCLVEGRDLPSGGPETVEALDRAIDEFVHRVLGHHLVGPIARTRLSESSTLAVMRLH